MKRILQVTGGMDRAGAETMIMNLYRAINRDKFQFDFLYFTDKETDFDDEILRLGGKIYRVVEKNPISRMQQMKKFLTSNPHWQIMHCHTLFSNAFHLYAAYKAGIKHRISHSHNTSDKSNPAWIATPYHYFSRKIQSKYATDFLACGVAAGDFLFPNNNDVKVIPNAIDTTEFAQTAENNKNYIRENFNLDKNVLSILQLGRFTEQKNHKFSLQIAKALKDKKVPFKLFFAGKGPLEEKIKEEAKTLGLENHVVFLGLRTDVPQILGGVDVMLMPSIHEGFPVVLIESQTAGIPSLISNTISAEVDLNLNLVHFESLTHSVETWADKILQIAQQKIPATDFRINSLKEQGFDIFANAKRLEQLYGSLL